MGEHATSMQKDPGHGIESRTILPQGNRATNCATVQSVNGLCAHFHLFAVWTKDRSASLWHYVFCNVKLHHPSSFASPRLQATLNLQAALFPSDLACWSTFAPSSPSSVWGCVYVCIDWRLWITSSQSFHPNMYIIPVSGKTFLCIPWLLSLWWLVPFFYSNVKWEHAYSGQCGIFLKPHPA